MNKTVFGKTMEMWENLEKLNLGQQKGEKVIYYHNQIIIFQYFSHKFFYPQNDKNSNTNYLSCLFRN